MIVNFFDHNISYAKSYNDALESGRKTKNIKYVKNQENWDGVTIFTDATINLAKNNLSKYKVAWIMEPRAYSPLVYNLLESIINDFDLILTYDHHLLEKYPQKTLFNPADGIFVDTESVFSEKINKNKLISHLFSEKTILNGHHLRHIIANHIIRKKYNVDLFGSGTGTRLEKKSDALNPYCFSIIIENNKSPNYFTEKILDSFACRTIPIYWGAPNITDWFDGNSIITFNSLENLSDIIQNLSFEEYQQRFSSLQKNYERCLNFYDYDEIIYKNIKRFIDEK